MLDRLGDLAEPLDYVQGTIEAAASQWEEGELHAGAAITAAEQAVERWLEQSESVERELLRYLEPSEQVREHEREVEETRTDALCRLEGLTLLHASIASDLATLIPLDEVGPDESPGAALPARERGRSAIRAVAFEEGEVMPLLRSADGEREPPEDLGLGISAELELEGGAVAGDVVRELIGRSADVTATVLLKLAPVPTGAAFAAVSPHLRDALNLAPAAIQDAIRAAARRIARLVKLLIARMHAVLAAVSTHYRNAVGSMLSAYDAAMLIAKRPVERGLEKIFGAQQISNEAMLRLNQRQIVYDEGRIKIKSIQPKERAQRVEKLRKLAKSNQRWVGSARIPAMGLKPLWAASIAGVPAAPAVGVVLIAWAIIITGDPLDAKGPYPNFWKGVLAIAGGQ